MKTTPLSIIVVVGIILFTIGHTPNSFASNFESIKQPYLSLINATKLNLVITNSSAFNEKTQGYQYTFETAISRLQYQENSSYVLGPIHVVYFLYTSNNVTPDRTLVATMDSNLKIYGMMEYAPWNVPLGYPLPIIGSYLPSQDNHTNVNINTLVNVIPPLPLEQVRHGVTVNNVECLDFMPHLSLIYKAEDNSPACVKDDTANVLIERGWAKTLQ